MTLKDAEQLALDLMQLHKVPRSWSFKFDSSKVRFGKCDYRKKGDFAVAALGRAK
jgi:hypothetical protein